MGRGVRGVAIGAGVGAVVFTPSGTNVEPSSSNTARRATVDHNDAPKAHCPPTLTHTRVVGADARRATDEHVLPRRIGRAPLAAGRQTEQLRLTAGKRLGWRQRKLARRHERCRTVANTLALTSVSRFAALMPRPTMLRARARATSASRRSGKRGEE